jgi:hypothetical protein
LALALLRVPSNTFGGSVAEYPSCAGKIPPRRTTATLDVSTCKALTLPFFRKTLRVRVCPCFGLRQEAKTTDGYYGLSEQKKARTITLAQPNQTPEARPPPPTPPPLLPACCNDAPPPQSPPPPPPPPRIILRHRRRRDTPRNRSHRYHHYFRCRRLLAAEAAAAAAAAAALPHRLRHRLLVCPPRHGRGGGLFPLSPISPIFSITILYILSLLALLSLPSCLSPCRSFISLSSA